MVFCSNIFSMPLSVFSCILPPPLSFSEHSYCLTYIFDISCLGCHDLGFKFCHSTATNFLFIVFHIFLKIYCLGCHNLGFREVRFEFSLCSNLNPLRGSGSYIPPNLIPKPQVQNQVRTRFGRFGNRTTASLLGS